MARTLFDKIWEAHVIADLGGGSALIAIDRIFLHERTGAAALKSMAEAGRTVDDPARVFAVMDHIVDTRPGRGDGTLMKGGETFITETRAACDQSGITLFDVNDPDQGITHVISPELGIVLPGLTRIAFGLATRNVPVTMACSASLEPMPQASAPNAPCVQVWLSGAISVRPGRTMPSSGEMTWVMP